MKRAPLIAAFALVVMAEFSVLAGLFLRAHQAEHTTRSHNPTYRLLHAAGYQLSRPWFLLAGRPPRPDVTYAVQACFLLCLAAAVLWVARPRI